MLRPHPKTPLTDTLFASPALVRSLPDRFAREVIAIGMGETLASGSAAVEAVGLHIGVAMEDYWHADDAFFALLRDKQVLTRIVAEVAGETVAAAKIGRAHV